MTQADTYRILLLEDEAGDALLMQLALKKTGVPVEIHHEVDGLDALHYLNSTATPRPDLILVDLKMPGMGGLEFLQALKKEPALCAIPAVVVSTSALPSDVGSAYQLGASGYLLKDADIHVFTATVLRFSDYWFKLVQLPGRET